jgi:hypothetical protein
MEEQQNYSPRRATEDSEERCTKWTQSPTMLSRQTFNTSNGGGPLVGTILETG